MTGILLLSQRIDIDIGISMICDDIGNYHAGPEYNGLHLSTLCLFICTHRCASYTFYVYLYDHFISSISFTCVHTDH